MHTSDTPIFWETLRDLALDLSAPPKAISGGEQLPGKVESAPLKVPAKRLPAKRSAPRKRGGK